MSTTGGFLRAAVVIVLSVLVITGITFAEVPGKVNYQGRLTDSSTGEPLPGSHEMIFKLYRTSSGGDVLWTETQTLLADGAGIVSAILGSTNPMDIDFDSSAWLEVAVDGEVLSPRREIVSVPYAFLAENADHASDADHASNSDSLGGYGSGDFVRVGQSAVITNEMIVGGSGSGLDTDKLDGLHADAFDDTGHIHDDRYYTTSELQTPGSINDGTNPVDWTNLKGVPPGFADGTDDGGAGGGHSLDAADGNPVDAVYVDNDGSVGIGTVSPSQHLHLYGSSSAILVESNSSNPEVMLASGTSTPSERWRIYMDAASGELRFSRDTDRMVLSYGTGRVGIGKSPGEKLDVDGSINLSEHLTIDFTTVLSVDGTSNTFVGENAGPSTTGGKNTFVGSGAGYGTGTGQYNVFVGNSAGYANTSGERNVFVGSSAGPANTDGYQNVFIGSYTGNSNTSGLNNTFVGMEAGKDNDEGDLNTFLGAFAGINNVNASDNTFVGANAGILNIGGQGNTCLGMSAGAVNKNGSNNTCIGSQAGGTCLGSNNVFVGSSAGILEEGSNNLYIANGPLDENVLIYGDFSTGDIGMGTLSPAPTYKLHIEKPDHCKALIKAPGVSGVAGLGLANSTSEWSIDVRGDNSDVLTIFDATADRYRFGIDRDGDVGIGTIDPSEKLHIIGNDSPRILVEAASGSPNLNLKNTGDSASQIWAIYKHGTAHDLRFYQNGDRLTIQDGTGSVGIGTSNPSGWKLYVNGDTGINGNVCANNVVCVSDMALKQDIESISNPLNKVLNLRGVTFRWRTEEYKDRNFREGRHYGVIAQEVEKVLPEAVLEVSDGKKAVCYEALVPVLIESIKEQQVRIENLEAEVAALRSQSGKGQ